jgi:hypothetical protein
MLLASLLRMHSVIESYGLMCILYSGFPQLFSNIFNACVKYKLFGGTINASTSSSEESESSSQSVKK